LSLLVLRRLRPADQAELVPFEKWTDQTLFLPETYSSFLTYY